MKNSILSIIMASLLFLGSILAVAEGTTSAESFLEREGEFLIVSRETQADLFMSYLPSGCELSDQDGSELFADSKVATGMLLKQGRERLIVVLLNDVNCDGRVSAADARLALRAAAGLESLSSSQTRAADANADGRLAAFDARTILRIAAGLQLMTAEQESSYYLALESQSAAASISESIKNAEFHPLLTQSPIEDISYFDDVVFIGDSVSLSLYNYNKKYNELGGARFLVAGSLSSMNALFPTSSSYSCHPYLNGKRVRLEDGVAALGSKKVYIMLGMNDISMGVDRAVENYTRVLELILEKSPDCRLIIQSTTPLARGSTSQSRSLNNTTIDSFNQKMLELCRERHWYFLDVASVMKDSEGYLKREFCSDYPRMGLHLTYNADSVWIEYIKNHKLP